MNKINKLKFSSKSWITSNKYKNNCKNKYSLKLLPPKIC